MKKSVIAEILLIFVAISWGMTFVPVAQAIKSVNVFSFLFWRFLIATIFMLIFCIKIFKFDKKSIYYGLFLGFWLFCGFAFQTYALKYSYSSTVAFITGFVKRFLKSNYF
ncbi:EamA family transporter [Campylobacter fetus]|uniref:EamA family transporter n=1 Tax=Campylobacter fetus TaxID=196 RepID=UPI001EE4C70E|nr:EamA family transporter [Campylobacter fetus]